jgi:hypothetical protein
MALGKWPFDKYQRKEANIDDLLKVYIGLPEVKKIIYSRLCEQAAAFDDWFKIYRTFKVKTEMSEIALPKIKELAVSFDQLKNKLTELAQTHEEVLFIAKYCKWEKFINRAFELTETPDQLFKLCHLAVDNVCQWKGVIKKEKKIKASFNEWHRCYIIHHNDSVSGTGYDREIFKNKDFMRTIKEMIFQISNSYEEYLFVYSSTEGEYPEIASQCLAQISKLAVVN